MKLVNDSFEYECWIRLSIKNILLMIDEICKDKEIMNWMFSNEIIIWNWIYSSIR